MPITHLTPEEANDVAAWLLSQKADGTTGKIRDWHACRAGTTETLKDLARVYLRSPVVTPRKIDDVLEATASPAERSQDR